VIGLVFLNVLAPVFLVFSAGYVLQKKLDLQMKSLSQTVFFLLLPALVFRTLYNSDLLGDLNTIIIFQLILAAALACIIKVIVFIFKMPQKLEGALLLSVVFMNAGNYGMPFNLFAFGVSGFELAVTFYAFQSILMNSLGVFFANKHRGGVRQSISAVLKLPILYAAILGVGLQLLGLEMPEFIYKSVDLLSNATAPLIMLLLGMQLAQVKFNGNWGPVGLGVALRLIVSPLIAFLIIRFVLPVEGLLFNVIIVESAMPSAVVMTLLAMQYDCEPDVVSAITFMSTIISIVTLSVILYLLPIF
jgi:predicted permease